VLSLPKVVNFEVLVAMHTVMEPEWNRVVCMPLRDSLSRSKFGVPRVVKTVSNLYSSNEESHAPRREAVAEIFQVVDARSRCEKGIPAQKPSDTKPRSKRRKLRQWVGGVKCCRSGWLGEGEVGANE